jgi:hypothetical protein
MTPLQERIDQEGECLRRATLVDIQGDYELTVTPDYFAQGVGSICGVDFYFGAKYGDWEFETQDQFGHAYAATHPLWFRRTGKHGTITLAWAAGCLRDCLAEISEKLPNTSAPSKT